MGRVSRTMLRHVDAAGVSQRLAGGRVNTSSHGGPSSGCG